MIDTHAHLDYLEDSSIAENLKQEGLELVINAGTCVETTTKGKELSEKYDIVYFTAGFHPGYLTGDDGDDAMEFNDATLLELEELAKHKKCVAIGEVGLDFHYIELQAVNGEITKEELANRKKEQERVFVEQIKLADRLNLPLMLHVRDAYEDCERVLQENINYINNTVIFHCYAGDAEFAQRIINLIERKGEDKPCCYFAFGGVITFKKVRDEKAEVIRGISKNRILTETDCPYLTPEPMRGKCENEPKYIRYIYERLATIWQAPFNEVEAVVRENAKRAFKL